MAVVGILHPGQMGVSVAIAASDAGNEVLWAGDGRGPDTVGRASSTSLVDVGSVAAMAEQADVIVSVCPPAFAVDVAVEVASTGFTGRYVDANAVSPTTAARVGAIISDAGATPVDGGIIGPPAVRAGSTRMYVSGEAAPTIVDLFAGGRLEVIALASAHGSASALKMAYAGWTKGSSALLLAIVAYAESAGVAGALRDEWNISQPGVADRAVSTAAGTGPKAWRFVGEMEEIAASLASAGLADGFHAAAAQTYAPLARFKGGDRPPTLDEVIAALLADGP